MTECAVCHPGRVSLLHRATQRDVYGMTDALLCHSVGVSLLRRAAQRDAYPSRVTEPSSRSPLCASA